MKGEGAHTSKKLKEREEDGSRDCRSRILAKKDVCCEKDDVESLGGVGSCPWGPLVDDLHHGKGEEMRKRRKREALC